MSKQGRLKEAKLYRVARNEVLMSDHPEIWIGRDGIEVSLGMLMHDVDRYIYESLHMDDNPLRYLRRAFPDFIWNFHESHDERQGVRIIAAADYIWMRSFGMVFDDLITATRKSGGKPRVLCYKPHNEDQEWVAPLRVLLPKIRFVVDGDATDAGTIIE
jgi:hypothetical protein